MNLDAVEQIAKAVLFEGYMLYPYRPSSVKNQQRFNWGVLCPPAYCERHPETESSSIQTECLVRGDAQTRLTVKFGFLQIVERLIARKPSVKSHNGTVVDRALEFVNLLEVDGRVYQPWQEAAERSCVVSDLPLPAIRSPRLTDFSFPLEKTIEELNDAKGCVAGAIIRQWNRLEGAIIISAKPSRDDIFKVTVRAENLTRVDPAALDGDVARGTVLPHALVSAHIILGVENGAFISLLEPPREYEDLAGECENHRAWPVLASDDATAMLASPIILYDHPAIAPESRGNLFDATEIDEILSLRILTLTDAEKDEIRQSDDRARELLDRTENIPDEEFLKLHGALRGLTSREEAQK